MEHVSVLKGDVQNLLDLKEGFVVVDATLGLGGHAMSMLEAIGKSGKLIGFDQDGRNLEEAQRRLAKYEKETIYIHDNFRHLKTRVTGLGFDHVDAILFDLGLSSPRVDDKERGFSFMKEGPLDMRFDQRSSLTAAEVINDYDEDELVRIFRAYGEEKLAKKIARRICERRVDEKFTSTVELGEFIESVVPKKRNSKKSSAHPATRVFQAVRIEVNDELNVLEETLDQAMEILKIGGRVAVISYHSLEDRIVKHFFKKLQRPAANEEESVYSNYGEPIVKAIVKKPVVPSDEEVEENPRSRSAKLRVYEKLREQ